MRIAIFSDCHCGFAYGEERGEDSFAVLNEAIEKSKGADIILIAGDIFDSRVPSQEVISRAIKIMNKAKHYTSHAQLVETDKKEKNHSSMGVPIVAIHGTHERRAYLFVNPVQLLDHAGVLIHLDAERAVFDCAGQKVAIHGMSGVPEQYAKETLLKWNPKPVANAINILMFHQSMEPYIYNPLEPPTLSPEDLPDGFDLYVLGHIHWHDKKPLKSGTLLLTGSMIPTSLNKSEMTAKKGMWFYDGNNITFQAFDYQRQIHEINIDLCENIEAEIDSKIARIPQTLPKPIIILNIKQKARHMLHINRIENKYKEKYIIVTKHQIEEDINKDYQTQAPIERLSPNQLGMKILKDVLENKQCHIKIEDFFESLVEGNVEDAFMILKQNYSNMEPDKND